jgi:predicted DCC family thiol-disulfide oxidoreductase YuxK
MPKDETKAQMAVVYDGDCPFCRNYVRLMALKESVGDVDIVDARSESPIAQRLAALGYDLNEGMAALYGGNVYFGSDAVILISTLSHNRSWLGRCIAALLREPRRARFLYPWMKAGRRIVLRLLGKPLIATPQDLVK